MAIIRGKCRATATNQYLLNMYKEVVSYKLSDNDKIFEFKWDDKIKVVDRPSDKEWVWFSDCEDYNLQALEERIYRIKNNREVNEFVYFAREYEAERIWNYIGQKKMLMMLDIVQYLRDFVKIVYHG